MRTGDVPAQLYGEDFRVGFSFSGDEREMTGKDFEAFAALTGDVHPIHYDSAYAAGTQFGRPVAHGLLLVGLSALGATALSRQLHASMIAFVGQGAEFRRPVFIGDRITPRYTVTSLKQENGKTRGLVRFQVLQVNAAEEICVQGFHVYMLRWKRPPAGGTA